MSDERLIIDGLELIEKINDWRNKDFTDSEEYTDRVICDVLDSVMDMIYDTEPIQPQGIDKNRLIEELEEGYEQEVGKLKMISVDKAVQIINQQPTTDGWIPLSKERPEKNGPCWVTIPHDIFGATVKMCNYCAGSFLAPNTIEEFEVIAWKPVYIPQPYKESEE